MTGRDRPGAPACGEGHRELWTSAEVVELPRLGPMQECVPLGCRVHEDWAVRILGIAHSDHAVDGSKLDAGSIADTALRLPPRQVTEHRADYRHRSSSRSKMKTKSSN